MKLSKYFAICAVTLWSAGAYAVKIAGVDVDEAQYPKTVKEMTGFTLELEESSAKMSAFLSDHIDFLEEARTKAFPDGDPAVAHKNFLDNAFENYEGFGKIDTKAWMALPSKGQYSNFSSFIGRLRDAQSCLSDIPSALVKMSMTLEEKAKSEDYALSPDPVRWFLQDPLNALDTNLLGVLRAENNLAHSSEHAATIPHCPPGSSLETWLIDTKGIHYEEFGSKNAVFSNIVSNFFAHKVFDPFIGRLNLVALQSSDHEAADRVSNMLSEYTPLS